MNIVVVAEAFLFKMKGKLIRVRDPVLAQVRARHRCDRARRHHQLENQAYFRRSIAKFEEYLASIPNNKPAMSNCAETLALLQGELVVQVCARV
jgi:hypothetical protein